MEEWPQCGRCGEAACPPVCVGGEVLCGDCAEKSVPVSNEPAMETVPPPEAVGEVGKEMENKPEEVATVGTNDFEAALKRIHEESGTKTQVQLAELLGIRQSSISDAKRRGQIPPAWLVKLFQAKGINPDWIVSGDPAPKYLAPVNDPGQAAMSIEELRRQVRAELAAPRTRADIFDEFQEAWPTAQITFPPKAAGA